MRADVDLGTIDPNLNPLYNFLFMISRENPEHSAEVLSIFDAIADRAFAIKGQPSASDKYMKELIAIFNFLQPALENNKLTIGETNIVIDAIYSNQLLQSMSALRSNLSVIVRSSIAKSAAEQQPAIPSEKAAPIRVTVKNDRLILFNPQHQIGKIDYSAANRVRESLRDTLSELIDQLPTSSNIDARYVTGCRKLLNYLSIPLEEVSIEALGLNYQLVDKMTKRMSDEISGIIIDQIEHTLTGISVLLNQFQEWKDYLEALAISQALSGESRQLVEHARSIARDFEKYPSMIERGIVQRLEDMIEPVINGFISADTVAVPLAGSLSNVFSALSQAAFEHMTSNANQSFIPASAAISVLFANFAVSMIAKYCPILSAFHPLKFIVDVQRYILKYYSQLKDATRLGSTS